MSISRKGGSFMTKLMSIIVGGALGLTLAASVGAGIAVGSNNEYKEARAADSVYAQATFNASNNQKKISSYTSTWTNITNNFSWSISNFNNNNTGPSGTGTWSYIKCGRNGSASTATISTTNSVSVAISKVSIKIDAITAANITSITLYGGSNASTSLGTFTKATGTQTLTIASNKQSANQKYKISFVCTSGSSNGLLTLSDVSLYTSTSEPSVMVSSESVAIGTNNSEGTTVSATVTNVASPTYNWVASNNNVVLTGANTSTVTIKPNINVGGTSTVTLTVGGTTPNLTATVEVVIYHQPYTVAEARSAIDANVGLTDVETSGIVCQVDSYSSQYNSITYWISDDGSTTDMLEVYSGKGLNGASFSAVTDVEVGAIVTIKGTLKKYNLTYEYDKNNYLLSYVVKTITSLTISGSMTKTMYSDGSQWNPEGLVVTAHYSDNTSSDVTGGVSWTYNPAVPTLGTTSVVATASFGGFTVSSSAQAVTVATTPYTNGLPYKMYLVNTQLSKTYYFTGAMGTGQQQYYGASSTDISEAVDVYFENHTGGGQNLYFNVNSTKNYITINKVTSGEETHYNFTFGTTAPTIGWGYNGNCLTYEIDGVDYTIATYGTYTTFGGSPASYNTNYPAQFSLSDSVTAATFAQEFLDNMTCDATGASAPTFASGYTWADFQVTFSQLPSSEQQTLQSATANESGTVVEQAMARYDYVVAKYSYNNFINRSISNSANRMNGIIDNNRVVLLTAVLGLLSTTAFAAFYILRKKKLA